MYRVYDKKKRLWLRDKVYLAPNEDLYLLKKRLCFLKTITLVSDNRYVFQNCINERDKNNKWIFEGDICKFDNDDVGLITYSNEMAAYILLDYNNEEYYTLTDEICNSRLEIVGNIFDAPELIGKEGA